MVVLSSQPLGARAVMCVISRLRDAKVCVLAGSTIFTGLMQQSTDLHLYNEAVFYLEYHCLAILLDSAI
jgi:hypothetical protein